MARQSRGPRRKTQWGGFGSASGTVAVPTFRNVSTGAANAEILSTSVIIGDDTGLLDEEVTIIRTIGSLFVAMQTETVDSEAQFAVGLGVFRNEALAVGVTALPSPIDRPDFEWLAYFSGGMHRGNIAGDDGGIGSFRKDFDIRAMRIMRSGENVAWICEAQTGNIEASVAGRYLMKLT